MELMPLQGVNILDLTHYWSGPTATRILADLGAQVIKVEYVRRMCVLRGAKKEQQAYNHHRRWHQVNRNKMSVTLDLKSSRDRHLFEELVILSNVVVDSYRGGVLAKLGYGYENLKKLKPDIIQVSMSAFGNSGPYKSYTGVGASVEAIAGIQSLTAYEADAKPFRIKEVDVISGVIGAFAIMSALVRHQFTGRGQYVDCAMMESSTHALLGEHLLEYVMNGSHPKPRGNRNQKYAPQGCYRCKGKDEWIVLSVSSDHEWQSLCEAMSHPEWKNDVRFATEVSRRENHNELDRLIEEWTVSCHSHELMEKFQKAKVPAGAVVDMQALIKDAHLKERDYFVTSEDGTEGSFIGGPIRFSGVPCRMRWRGPDLGKHNREVFAKLLRRTSEEVRVVKEEDIGTGYDPE